MAKFRALAGLNQRFVCGGVVYVAADGVFDLDESNKQLMNHVNNDRYIEPIQTKKPKPAKPEPAKPEAQ